MRAPSLRLALVPAVLALAACTVSSPPRPIPLDQYAFPTGLALSGNDLLVVSSNFDLKYDQGSLTRLDVSDLTAAAAARPSGVHIANFGGQVAVAGPECGAAYATPRAIVPSRQDDGLWDVPLADTLTCQNCRTPIDVPGGHDPYSVAVTCGPGITPRAFVGYLRSPTLAGYLTVLDLTTGVHRTITTGIGGPRAFAYDEGRDRLYFSAVYGGSSAPIRWLELAGGCTVGGTETSGGCPVRSIDLSAKFRGSEPAGIALSHPRPGEPRRLYVALRLYDADLASAYGTRPVFDIGGMLLVLDLVEGPLGEPAPVVVRAIDIGLGVSEVQLLPARDGKRDLVALTASEDGRLFIYDDETGSIAKVIGRDSITGAPLLGRLPFGMAMQDLGNGTARLFVASFEDGWVTPVDVPLDAPETADAVRVPGNPSQILRLGSQTP